MFDKLINKIQSANWKYEVFERENDWKHVEFFVPKEREEEILRVSNRNRDLAYFVESNFEKYRYIKGFEAIWSKELRRAECELVTYYGPSNRRILSTLDKLFSKEKNDDSLAKNEEMEEVEGSNIKDNCEEDTLEKITVFNSNGIQVSIGICSSEFAILSSMKTRYLSLSNLVQRTISLHIDGISIEKHEDALRTLLKVSNSLLFQLSDVLDIPLKLRNERPNRVEIEKQRKSKVLLEYSCFPMTSLKYDYDNEPMSLYLHGKTSIELPLYQFLSFYQSIEYYFPVYANIEARKKIQRMCKDPNFNPNSDSQISKILSIVRNSRNGEISDEKSQLKATVKSCIENDEIIEFILASESRSEYYEKNQGKKLSSYLINIKSKNNDVVGEVCDRIYDMRCKIVHKKANDGEDIILPFSPEIKDIKHDIDLLELIAKKVLINNSRPLSLL